MFLGIHVEMYTEQPSSKQPPSKQNRMNLQDKLSNMYNRAELLTGDNRYHCQTCSGLQDAAIECRLSESGRYLVVTPKRFYGNGKGESKKVHDIIDHPVALPIPGSDIYYTLFALLFHYGKTLERGHYTAHFLSGDSWISANDENISEVVNTQEYPGTGGHFNNYASRNVYMLVYKREGMVSMGTPHVPLRCEQLVKKENFFFLEEAESFASLD